MRTPRETALKNEEAPRCTLLCGKSAEGPRGGQQTRTISSFQAL